jgi:hypothetical protein
MFVEVNWETGMQFHVILFVRGYSLQQFRKRYGNRHLDFPTIILNKRIILNPLMKAPHIRPNDAQ